MWVSMGYSPRAARLEIIQGPSSLGAPDKTRTN